MTDWVRRQTSTCEHESPDTFVPGEPLVVCMRPADSGRPDAFLHYRHVDQSTSWCQTGMTWSAGRLVGEIPSAYTDSPFPLQYYFEISRDGEVTLSPGLAENLCNKPYYAVRRSNR